MPLPLDAAETGLVSLFAGAHFQLSHHVTLEGGRKLMFTGVRRVLDRSYRYKGIRHDVPEQIGSAFYVTIDPTAEGSQIWLYGKPVVDHDVTCASFDHEYDVLSCDAVNLMRHSGIFASGHEEADVIRWVVTVLAQQNPSARAASPEEIAIRHAGN